MLMSFRPIVGIVAAAAVALTSFDALACTRFIY
jgi:hypothetical protein